MWISIIGVTVIIVLVICGAIFFIIRFFQTVTHWDEKIGIMMQKEAMKNRKKIK